MESSSGSATLAPIPFSALRRVIVFLVRNVMRSLPYLLCRGLRHPALERSAAHHALHKRGERVVLARRFPGVRFVRYDAFGSTHGRDEQRVLAELPAKLKALEVDAVISGMAC